MSDWLFLKDKDYNKISTIKGGLTLPMSKEEKISILERGTNFISKTDDSSDYLAHKHNNCLTLMLCWAFLNWRAKHFFPIKNNSMLAFPS